MGSLQPLMLQNCLFAQEEKKYGVDIERYVQAVEQGVAPPRCIRSDGECCCLHATCTVKCTRAEGLGWRFAGIYAHIHGSKITWARKKGVRARPGTGGGECSARRSGAPRRHYADSRNCWLLQLRTTILNSVLSCQHATRRSEQLVDPFAYVGAFSTPAPARSGARPLWLLCGLARGIRWRVPI